MGKKATTKDLSEGLEMKMRRARLAYSLSARRMSAICGMGVNVWSMYEKDASKMSKSNSLLVGMTLQPHLFLELLNMVPEVDRWPKFNETLERVKKIDGVFIEESNNHLKKNRTSWLVAPVARSSKKPYSND